MRRRSLSLALVVLLLASCGGQSDAYGNAARGWALAARAYTDSLDSVGYETDASGTYRIQLISATAVLSAQDAPADQSHCQDLMVTASYAFVQGTTGDTIDAMSNAIDCAIPYMRG